MSSPYPRARRSTLESKPTLAIPCCHLQTPASEVSEEASSTRCCPRTIPRHHSEAFDGTHYRLSKSRFKRSPFDEEVERLGAALAHSGHPLMNFLSLARTWRSIQQTIRYAILTIVQNSASVPSP